MPHDVTLITTIAAALGLALVMGYLATRLGAPPIVGYLVAGIIILLRALESRGVLSSVNGRIAIGWLVVEDLVTVLVLVLISALAGVLGGRAPAATPGSGIARSRSWGAACFRSSSGRWPAPALASSSRWP